MSFLPVTRADMEERGWEQLDFIFVSGDAYVDHPSFGPAILCRLLEKHGYKVGIIPQPDWHHTKDFTSLGKPRLGFLVSSGNLDSQLNRYTAAKRLRHDDSYSPGARGQSGLYWFILENCGNAGESRCLLLLEALRPVYGGLPIMIIGRMRFVLLFWQSVLQICWYTAWGKDS